MRRLPRIEHLAADARIYIRHRDFNDRLAECSTRTE